MPDVNATTEQIKIDALKVTALRKEAESQGCLVPDKIVNFVDTTLVSYRDGILYGVTDVVAQVKASYPELFTAKRRTSPGTPNRSESAPSTPPPARVLTSEVDQRNTMSRKILKPGSRM